MEQLINRYKKTEIGIIPNDWIVISISASCKLINGRGFKPYEWSKKGLPIIRIQNLNGSDEYNYYEGSYDKKIEVTKGQILYAWSGSRGTSFGPHIWHNRLGLLNYHTWKVVVNEEKINSNFFFHALKKLTKFIEEKAHGASALVHVQKWEMEKFKFPTPISLTEQKAIADALSDVDELIANLEKLIAKKKAIKQGAMQQLLTPPHKGGKRLEGFSGEWKEVRIGELGNTYGGLTGKSKHDFQNGQYYYITFLNVMNNTIIQKNEFEKVSINKNEKQNLALKGDLFFNTSSETPEEVGMCSVLLEDISNLYLNSFCFGFRLNKPLNVDGLFLSYYFNSPVGRKHFLSLAQGATRYNLSKFNFNQINFYLPPFEEQISIASVLNTIDLEISSIEKKLLKSQQVKQGMMQELLTGKTRLI